MASSNQTTLCLVLTEQLTKPLLCNLNTTYLLTLLPENLKRSIIIINSSGTIYYAAQFFAKKITSNSSYFRSSSHVMYVCTYMHFKNSFKTQTGMYTVLYTEEQAKNAIFYTFIVGKLGQKREREEMM